MLRQCCGGDISGNIVPADVTDRPCHHHHSVIRLVVAPDESLLILIVILSVLALLLPQLLQAVTAGALPLQAPSPLPSTQEKAGTSTTASLEYWIVEGDASGKLAPNCSDLCLTVLDSQRNLPVALQPCQGQAATELWLFDAQARSIATSLGSTSTTNSRLCLDASNYATQLQLSACNTSSPYQTWDWDASSMRITIGINDTNTGSKLYLQGQSRKATDWGSGTNVYNVSLASGNTDDAPGITPVFTPLPYYNPVLVKPPPAAGAANGSNSSSLTGGNNVEVVKNGGFEGCGWDPGNGFITISTTQPILLCSWFVVSNEIEYSGKNLWQPEEGTHSVHLNSANWARPAALAQVLATRGGANYTLVFYMAGNPELVCGPVNKTMKVEVAPSSLAPQFLWFDISEAGPGRMGWRRVYPMGFTALAPYVNLTFTSLTPGSCGPVIDNITVQETPGPLPPLDPVPGNSAASPAPPAVDSTKGVIPAYGIAFICLAGAALLGCLAFVLITHLCGRGFIHSNRMSAPSSFVLPATGTKFWESFSRARADGTVSVDTSGCRELTWRQIEKATKNFTTVVGEGGFSTVYRAEFSDGTVGAVKIEKTRDRSRQLFKQELSVLLRVRHPNLVNLIGFCNEREEGVLVFEYMAHGNLHYRLHPAAHQMYEELAWGRRMTIAVQVARGLEYLHEVARPTVVHGDVKSANVLLSEADDAKLCDFGFAAKGGPTSSVFHSMVASAVKGSLGYLDPQYLKTGRLSAKSDVYSFGVLLLELLTGMYAFDMHRTEALASFASPYIRDPDMMELVVDSRLRGRFDRPQLRLACRVAQLCTRDDAALRPTMGEVADLLSGTSPHLLLADDHYTPTTSTTSILHTPHIPSPAPSSSFSAPSIIPPPYNNASSFSSSLKPTPSLASNSTSHPYPSLISNPNRTPNSPPSSSSRHSHSTHTSPPHSSSILTSNPTPIPPASSSLNSSSTSPPHSSSVLSLQLVPCPRGSSSLHPHTTMPNLLLSSP